MGRHSGTVTVRQTVNRYIYIYCQLKEELLDRTMWRNRFGRGFGPVVWQITNDDGIYIYIYILYLYIILIHSRLGFIQPEYRIYNGPFCAYSIICRLILQSRWRHSASRSVSQLLMDLLLEYFRNQSLNIFCFLLPFAGCLLIPSFKAIRQLKIRRFEVQLTAKKPLIKHSVTKH